VLLNCPSLGHLEADKIADICYAVLARAKSVFLPGRSAEDKRVVLVSPSQALVDLLRVESAAEKLAGSALVFSASEAAKLLGTRPSLSAEASAAAAAAEKEEAAGGGGGPGSNKREARRKSGALAPAVPAHSLLLKDPKHPEAGEFEVPCVIVFDMTCKVASITEGVEVGKSIEQVYSLFGDSSKAAFHLLTKLNFDSEDREGRSTAIFISADPKLGGMGDTDAHVMVRPPPPFFSLLFFLSPPPLFPLFPSSPCFLLLRRRSSPKMRSSFPRSSTSWSAHEGLCF